jgi:hypothetical protein
MRSDGMLLVERREMKRYDTYGSRDLSLEAAAGIVTKAFGVVFRLHESDNLGGDYFRGQGPGIERAILHHNIEYPEEQLYGPEFPDHRILLHLTPKDESDSDQPPTTIPNFELLKTRWL